MRESLSTHPSLFSSSYRSRPKARDFFCTTNACPRTFIRHASYAVRHVTMLSRWASGVRSSRNISFLLLCHWGVRQWAANLTSWLETGYGCASNEEALVTSIGRSTNRYWTKSPHGWRLPNHTFLYSFLDLSLAINSLCEQIAIYSCHE